MHCDLYLERLGQETRDNDPINKREKQIKEREEARQRWAIHGSLWADAIARSYPVDGGE